ncbi:asparagine synthetase B family protein [Streptomyces sp. NPDC017095]|uniref:asparagine synthetase B family protein n=1 Tax=Streptomyces sp. NPDC017095 TaxID=3364977 RepID=UPI0037AE21AA
MSSFAGWSARSTAGIREADFHRVRTDLAVRGRAGHGIWRHERAALVQTVGPTWTGPKGPAVLERAGAPPVAVVFDGHLANAAGLAASLALRPGYSPSELVAHAYLRWGRAAVERFQGDFALAVLDADRVLLGRDRLGIKPLSYLETENGLLFSSDLATLARHPWARPRLTADGLSALITQLRPPGRGVLADVREVVPGTTVEFRAGGAGSEARYWSLQDPPETTPDRPVEQVRELLDDAVRRALGDAEPAVLLSGGLDSSVLTGLAAGLAKRPPRTFTVVFDQTGVPVPDRPYAQEVVDFLGCEHHEAEIDPRELSAPGLLAEVAAAKDHPTPFGDKNITPYVFGRRVAEAVPVVLSGEGADAVFTGLGGDPDPTRTLTSFPWIERSRRFGLPYGIGAGLFDAGLLTAIDVSGWIDSLFREAVAEVRHPPGASRTDRLAREIDHLTITRLLEQTVLHSERISTAAGLEVRFPFADAEVVSAVYHLPAREKSFDGREKSLLRALGHHLVPESVRTRPKVPYPITYDRYYKSALVHRLRALLDDSAAPVHALLDRRAAVAVVDDPSRLDRGGWLGRADAEMVLQLDAWLRRLHVRIEL